jgi:hypothetical protein
MPERKMVTGLKLDLREGNIVIDSETGEVVPGIAVLNARPPLPASDESPYAAMKRWSESRQSPAEEIG